MQHPEFLPDETDQYLEYTIEAENVGRRLDRYLVTLLEEVSRTAIQQLIANDLILVSRKSSKPGYLLRLNDSIQILQSTTPAHAGEMKAQAIPLNVVYEDDNLVVINKAAGMVVHTSPGHYDGTLVNALLARYPELQRMGEEMNDARPGIVHRLDKDTSGLIIVALNAQTLTALAGQMMRHEIVKRYLALVEGNIALDQGTIDAPIGRDARNRQYMTITASEGKEARTHFRVLQRFARHTLLLLQLETGRTHQIRVHLRAIGHPVVGDPVYGSGTSLHDITLDRQFLHAYQLKFMHPITGVVLALEAPLSADLQAVLDHIPS